MKPFEALCGPHSFKPIEPDLKMVLVEVGLNVGYMASQERLHGPTCHSKTVRQLQEIFSKLLMNKLVVTNGQTN